MTWDRTYESAMDQARSVGIPSDHAEKMWVRYNEIGVDVRAGIMTDTDGLHAFGEFCSRLASLHVGVDPAPGVEWAHAEADRIAGPRSPQG